MGNRSSQPGFASGVALGATIGAVGVFLLCMAFSSLGNKWADLVGVVITTAGATGAAYIALGGVYSSIAESRRVEESARERKLAAAKATLPLALADLFDVCNANCDWLALGKQQGAKSRRPLDYSSVGVFKECIEYATGPAESALRELLVIYQILEARLADIDVGDSSLQTTQDSLEKIERISAISGWATLQALTEALFPFARSPSNIVDRVSVAARALWHLWSLNIDGWALENDPMFRQRLEKARETGRVSEFSDPDWLDKTLRTDSAS